MQVYKIRVQFNKRADIVTHFKVYYFITCLTLSPNVGAMDFWNVSLFHIIINYIVGKDTLELQVIYSMYFYCICFFFCFFFFFYVID